MTQNEMGEMLEAANPYVHGLEHSADPDGTVSFEAVLPDGRFIMCERSPRGRLNAGIYEGPRGQLLEFMENADPERVRKLLQGRKTGRQTGFAQK